MKGGIGLQIQQKFSELRCKEVINICDCRRLGYVSDLSFEAPSGQILALIVPGPCRFFGLFGRSCDYCIPWGSIKRVGEDIILVDVVLEQVCLPRAKRGFFT